MLTFFKLLLILTCLITNDSDDVNSFPISVANSAPNSGQSKITQSASTSNQTVLPITRLQHAVIIPDLCQFHYTISTQSEMCQRFCDQAQGYYYSYVWMESARSFEQALQHDPECAFAWLGLSKALDKWGKNQSQKSEPLFALFGSVAQIKLPIGYDQSPRDYALDQAKKFMAKANHREELLIKAKLQERGLWPNVKADERKKTATATLDELLALYEDDQEGWFARAQIAEGTHGPAPFYKSLLKLNPLHPGANHEFVHFYEQIRRPALGWLNAEKYMESSPKIPHAFHMQAHLAMRVGKWDQTTNNSQTAYNLQKQYHNAQGVVAKDDHQFNHHMQTLMIALVHDGRFDEADQLNYEAGWYQYRFDKQMLQKAFLKKDWNAAEKIIDHVRRKDKKLATFYSALLNLERYDLDRAKSEIDILQQNEQTNRGSEQDRFRLWELQGRYQCLTGNSEGGIKNFKRLIAKTKDDFNHHAWGNGAVYMEAWGIAGLEAGLASEAEEAFQEALAHDAASVRGALGLWALCDRLNRPNEASRYLKLAKKCWAKATVEDFDRVKNDLRQKADRLPTATASTTSTNTTTTTTTNTKSAGGGK